jgi:hypothetical protein
LVDISQLVRAEGSPSSEEVRTLGMPFMICSRSTATPFNNGYCRQRLAEQPRRKAASKKIADTQKGSLFAFSISLLGGAGGQYVGFLDHWGQFRFCFFHSFWSGKKKAVRLAAESK